MGSNNLSSGNDWRFLAKYENGDINKPVYWTGGIGSLMVIPYGKIPANPKFPSSLPSLSDLILSFAAAPSSSVSMEGLVPKIDSIEHQGRSAVASIPAKNAVVVNPVADRRTDAVETVSTATSLPSWEGIQVALDDRAE